MTAQLLQANIENKMENLDHVAKLLTDLKSAWDTIETNSRTASAPAPAVAPPVDGQAAGRDALSYGRA